MTAAKTLDATNIAQFVSTHRVGRNDDGAALYQVEPQTLTPAGECYRDADGLVVVPEGEQLDLRVSDDVIEALRTEAEQRGDDALAACCDVAQRGGSASMAAVVKALQNAAAMG